MARSCDCTGVCSCILQAGENVVISGTGTTTSPYIIEVQVPEISIEAADTPSVNMTVSGSGDESDPFVVSAAATVALLGLIDVDGEDTPSLGSVPTWDGTQFVLAPPSVPPGSVTAGDGLAGDGSAPNPLRVRTSGTWGTPPLDTGDQDDGLEVYLDSLGALRAQAPAPIAAERLRLITISDVSPTPEQGSNGDVWLEW